MYGVLFIYFVYLMFCFLSLLCVCVDSCGPWQHTQPHWVLVQPKT